MRRLTGRGLSLVELVVAIAVVALGSVAALRTTDAARRAIGGEEPRLMARIAARNHAEALQLGQPAPPTEVRIGLHPITLTTDTAETAEGWRQITIVARSRSGQGARLVTWQVPDR